MCYTVIPTPRFLQDIEYYEKKKKFKNIPTKKELANIIKKYCIN